MYTAVFSLYVMFRMLQDDFDVVGTRLMNSKLTSK